MESSERASASDRRKKVPNFLQPMIRFRGNPIQGPCDHFSARLLVVSCQWNQNIVLPHGRSAENNYETLALVWAELPPMRLFSGNHP
jgi:hypothetical protein